MLFERVTGEGLDPESLAVEGRLLHTHLEAAAGFWRK